MGTQFQRELTEETRQRILEGEIPKTKADAYLKLATG